MRRLTITIAAAIAALLALASGAAAQGGPQASFEYTPAHPVAGEEISFRSTTTSSNPARIDVSWDLDGDGAFDDGRGSTVKMGYATAGTYLVRMRAVQASAAGGGSDVAEQQIVVAAAGQDDPPTPEPQPQPQPQPEPEPEPTPPQPDGANQPPVARYDRDCRLNGPKLLLCAGLVAREGQPEALDASPSSDPDGTIVKYEWDLDNNGQFERDAGADPTLVHTFEPLSGLVDVRKRTISVRVTDDKGASATDTVTISLLEPACEENVSYVRLKARGQCLRPRKLDKGGKQWVRWTSRDPVVLNGITIAPLSGRRVTIEVPATPSAGLRPRISSTGASVVTPVEGTSAELLRGVFAWEVVNERLFNFTLGDKAALNGLKITGMPEEPRLNPDGTASFKVHLGLPKEFGPATSDEPIAFSTGGVSAAGGDAFQFSVANASIGPIGLEELTVKYDGEDFWQIFGKVGLPAPVPYSIEGGAGVRGGKFEYAEGGFDFGSPGVGPFGPMFIQRISFRVEIKPEESNCVPKVGVETFDLREELHRITGAWFDVDPIVVDHGYPTFALCGNVKLTAGPNVDGHSVVSLDAGLGFATYDDRPHVFRAFGTIEFIGIPLANAKFEQHTNGYTKLNAHFKWGIPDVAHLEGSLLFEMLAPKFNAKAYVEACLDFIDWCAGARAVLSSKGVAVCLKIDVLFDDWEPGFGYKWGETFPTLYFAGCELGPFSEKIDNPGVNKGGPLRKLAGEEQTVDLPAGLPGAAIVATGKDAPPKITLIGPNGERVTTPDGNMPVEQKPFLLLKDPRAKLTQIAIGKPAAGRWRVLVEDGSSEVVSIKAAEGIAPPKVEASVTGSGQDRAINFTREQREGEKVTFVERGPSTGNYLGEARGAKGTLPFRPADGRAEKRDIVALVERDGQVVDEIEVDSYLAPPARKPDRPQRLKVRRRNSALALSWTRSRSARTHEVVVRLSDGRRLAFRTKRNSLTVRGVKRGLRGSATVRGVLDTGMAGPAAKAKVPRR